MFFACNIQQPVIHSVQMESMDEGIYINFPECATVSASLSTVSTIDTANRVAE